MNSKATVLASAVVIFGLTITPERSGRVDFCDPMGTGVSEILVTGPKSPEVKNSSDLSGREIYVRKSSSYYESLKAFNRKLKEEGKKPVKIVPADENLEDEDLLEMLNAGLIPMTVIDSHKGKFWAQIFKRITLYPEIRFRENASIAWAVQKGTPNFKAKINAFVKQNKRGTLMGNLIFKRYLENTRYVSNSLAEKMNLDPHVWFKNVGVAAAKRIGQETVQYVSNIFKYYVAYKLTAGKGGF